MGTAFPQCPFFLLSGARRPGCDVDVVLAEEVLILGVDVALQVVLVLHVAARVAVVEVRGRSGVNHSPLVALRVVATHIGVDVQVFEAVNLVVEFQVTDERLALGMVVFQFEHGPRVGRVLGVRLTRVAGVSKGGIGPVPYRLSFGYTNEDGILKTSNFERYTLSLNLAPTFFKEHLAVTLNAKFMSAKNRYADGGAIGAALSMDPTQPVYFKEGDPDMSVMTEMKDLKAVIDYAESLPYTDADRLVLMGCSQGGLVWQGS